jgi:four helix bundle protein
MSDFKRLEIWRRSHALAVQVVRTCGRFKRQHPRLVDQMSRSSESIPAAIADGRGKRTDKDFANYMTTAISSASELEGQIQRAFDLRLLSEENYAAFAAETIEVRKMMIGFRKKLEGR